MIDFKDLPKEVRDKIELKEATDMTFSRFVDEDYSDVFWNVLAERADPDYDHSIIISLHGGQGCYSGVTNIVTENGLEEIQNIKNGTKVWTGRNWKECVKIDQGVQETLKVKLNSKLSFELTPDHKIFTKNGEKEAKDLKEGDVMVVEPVPWSVEWNKKSEKAAVIAMLLFDGHLDVQNVKEKYNYKRKTTQEERFLSKNPREFHKYDKKRVRFYKSDEKLHDKFNKWIKHFGECSVSWYNDKGTESTKVACLQNADVFDSLVKHGAPVGKKGQRIEIPGWILQDDAAMNGFLSAMIQCDSHVYKNQNTLEISSTSEKIINQIAYWLYSRGVVVSLNEKEEQGNYNKLHRIFLSQPESYNKLLEHVKIIGKKKMEKKSVEEKVPGYVKYSRKRVANWSNRQMKGESYRSIANSENIWYATVYNAVQGHRDGTRGKKKRKKNTRKDYYLTVSSIEEGERQKVYDLKVVDDHTYIANGVLTHNSGKSYAALALCCFLDPEFSIDNIYFNYNELVYDRHNLEPNSAVLVDEQSETFGLDSHRVNIIMSSLKEQLRKKSIHFILCSPTLYPEHKSSMYIMETVFIDYGRKEAYLALKTNELLTLGHVRVPHPLKKLDDGRSLANPSLIKKYQEKKDKHLNRLLGKDSKDIFEERAEAVMEHEMFQKAENIYVDRMGYMPQKTMVQIINKIFPEFNAGVVPQEIAGRIKLNKEISGEWDISGRTKRKKKKKK